MNVLTPASIRVERLFPERIHSCGRIRAVYYCLEHLTATYGGSVAYYCVCFLEPGGEVEIMSHRSAHVVPLDHTACFGGINV